MRQVPEWAEKQILVLGCGNSLFGDDGFGPAVARYLQASGRTSPQACVMDVGSAARGILFDVTVGERRPRRVIVVDAMDCGRAPGEVFELSLDDIPKTKIDDFSIHQVPSSNLLRELRDLCGVEVVVLACQVEQVPDEVKPGLSEPVRAAVGRAGETILKEYLHVGGAPLS